MGDGFYALIGRHTTLMVSLLLVQGVEFPGDALWFQKNHGNFIVKEYRVSLPSFHFLKKLVVSGIFLYNFLLVNHLDLVERIEHDPENLH